MSVGVRDLIPGMVMVVVVVVENGNGDVDDGGNSDDTVNADGVDGVIYMLYMICIWLCIYYQKSVNLPRSL